MVDRAANNQYHNKAMARPPKDKSLLMSAPLRIMLTPAQKNLIDQAAQLGQMETASWARPILLQAAQEAIAKAQPALSRKARRK
jgi:hypothetical protein